MHISRLRAEPSPALHPTVPPRSALERLPKWLLCVPLVLHWFLLAIRHRSLTLPGCANPVIPNGGLAGESKLGCLRLIQPRHAAWVAPTVAVPPSPDPCAAAAAARAAAGFAFPLVAKPDVGWCGYGVRRIDDADALAAYARAFPRAATFLLQPWAPGPMEAGLMYRRDPAPPGRPASEAPPGRVVGVTLRHGPAVRGDGRSSVAALVDADPRLRRQPALPRPGAVPPAGNAVPLATVASLRAGGRYEDAPALVTPALSRRVDALARGMGAFHAGRFDVRFASLDALRAGRFTVIEVNGAGSEWIGAWDPSRTLRQAFGLVFANHRAVFALGAAMRARGHRPDGPLALSRAWLRQQRLARNLPPSN